MSDLPDSWVEVPIGAVARIVGGGTPPSKDPANFAAPGHGIPWLTPADLSGYRKQTIEQGKRDLTEVGFSACGATLMPKGTVLFSSRAPIGYVAIAANEISTNQGFKSFILPPDIDARFTYYQLKWLKPEAEAIATGTTFKELSGAATATLPFKVAPVAEQTRIANQLDILLTRIQSCNDRFDAIPALLKRFRQTVLDAATLGKLTEDWRDAQPDLPSAAGLIEALADDVEASGGHIRGNASEPTKEAHDLTAEKFPDGWKISTLKDCCTPGRPITYGILKPGPELEQGVPYIRVADFPGNQLKLVGIKKTSPEIDLQFKRARLIAGDLLLSIRGSVGRLIEIPEVLEGANITQDTARLSINKRLNSRYVYFVLLAPDTQRRMTNAIRGVAVRGINIGDVRALQLPIPSSPEQIEIVRRVDALLALADRIEARATAARTQAQRLSSLVLAKAFRGELVEQNPQDEPASALLQRIALTKPAKATASRGRPHIKTQGLFSTPEVVEPNWTALPDGVWAGPEAVDEHVVMAILVAVLKTWCSPMLQAQARLAAVLCLQPRQMTAALPAEQAAQWQRLAGPAADPLPKQVARLQPATDRAWRKALLGMRARGDLVEEGSGPQATWALGPGTGQIETAGWPEGRAGWVVAYLRAHGAQAILPLLDTLTMEFVHARAA